jgi:hypothetical protein
MSSFNINLKCPDCKKELLIEGKATLAVGGKKAKVGAAKKKSTSSKKSTTPRKRTPKKGKYDEDLEKLIKLKRGGSGEEVELSPQEQKDPKLTLKKMEEAAKASRKKNKSGGSLDGQIQTWLSGGPNPFSE